MKISTVIVGILLSLGLLLAAFYFGEDEMFYEFHFCSKCKRTVKVVRDSRKKENYTCKFCGEMMVEKFDNNIDYKKVKRLMYLK